VNSGLAQRRKPASHCAYSSAAAASPELTDNQNSARNLPDFVLASNDYFANDASFRYHDNDAQWTLKVSREG
jgi:hypothetical protein